jgi:hypothetical protein
MDLQILWFCLIAAFWSGYFLLEGFDFGVGMLLPFVPRDEKERDVMFPSGTATRSGSSWQAGRPSPRFRPGTEPCSPGSTSHSCFSSSS